MLPRESKLEASVRMDRLLIGIIVVVILVIASGVYLIGGTKLGLVTHTVTTSTSTIPPAKAANPPTIIYTTTIHVNVGYQVNLEYNYTVGNYLANSSGDTLYVYTGDLRYSGKTACYGQCTLTWKPFYTTVLTVSPGINASKFGTMTRTNGSLQLTYEGMPLYLYARNTTPGLINGTGPQSGFIVAAQKLPSS